MLAKSGNPSQTSHVTPRAGPETVYNFEVAREHVYYVGSDGLLVHNWYLQLKLSKAGNLLQLNKNSRWARVPLIKKASRLINELHHAIPRFVGGFAKQNLVSLSKPLHRKLHDMIDDQLVKRGLPKMRAGGDNFQNAVAQKRALGAVAAASKAFDKKYGTNVFQTFINEIKKGHFDKFW